MVFTDFYAQRRNCVPSATAFQEGHGSFPAERLVQAIWQQQRLLRDRLRTLDGQPVRILHPGFKNHGAGPDFHGAMIQIGSEPLRNGDIEVDLRPSGWQSHGHDRNPNFKNVILHVIWEGERPSTTLPTLALQNLLDAPIAELSTWLGRDSLNALPEDMQGRCCAPLLDLSGDKLTELLHQAARIRWQSKAHQFQSRARQVGWEQTLWEGLFRALGYKQNIWPMQSLAESQPHWLKLPANSLDLQARLLGISGLLPAELSPKRTSADGYVRRVWDQWWREQDEFSDYILPRKLWCFHGLRPANHPQRRLALAAHWRTSKNFLSKLETWFTASLDKTELVDSLLQTLQIEQDEFWSWHWTLRSTRLAKPQPLLGSARVTDLAINVILPWFWIRAVEGKNEKLQRVAEERYFAWPSAEDNSLFRLARQRLLASATPKVLRGAAAQQGLLQIVRDFCDHSNAICENCQFPELVREWSANK
ncbi:MAG: hypothetical protein JWQ71_3718 [Pedosphaera sp.]|nr:hypothetical protein [Pedosphaera sp.]